MAPPGKLAKIATERGVPIEQALADDLNRFGTLVEVAHQWDISYRILSNLYTDSGIVKTTRYSLPEPEHA